jgi:Flp pilus assembly protein TadD
MGEQFDRAWLLFQHRRFAQAVEELNREIKDWPDSAVAFAVLALCLTEMGDKVAARAAGAEAIRLAPDSDYCHYAQSVILSRAGEIQEAELAIGEAIRLNPRNAEYFSVLSILHSNRRGWGPALQAADEGLKQDPNHIGCCNLRALSLLELGRRDEARRTIKSALEIEPENHWSKSTLGWVLLNVKDFEPALEAFRDSLRIAPHFEAAREGLVQALKTRNPIYRHIFETSVDQKLKSFRPTVTVAWPILVVFLASFGRSGLGDSEAIIIMLAGLVIIPLLVICGCLMVGPASNLMLCFDRFGRYALTDRERASAMFGVGLGIVILVVTVATLVMGFVWNLFLVFGTSLLIIPLAIAFGSENSKRPVIWIYTSILALAWVAVILISDMEDMGAEVWRVLILISYLVAIFGCNRIIPHLLKR